MKTISQQIQELQMKALAKCEQEALKSKKK